MMKADDLSENIFDMNDYRQQKERHILTTINKDKYITKAFLHFDFLRNIINSILVPTTIMLPILKSLFISTMIFFYFSHLGYKFTMNSNQLFM